MLQLTFSEPPDMSAGTLRGQRLAARYRIAAAFADRVPSREQDKNIPPHTVKALHAITGR